MNHLDRRQLIKVVGSGVALAAAPFVISAQTTPRHHVVVIGGGFGGATAAKYLRLWSGGTVKVTLVDPAAAHISCIGSNLVLNGQSSLVSLTRSYAALQSRGVVLNPRSAQSVNPATHQVQLEGGYTLDYDHVILAPGIDFLPVPGHDFNLIPHAWIAGPQTTLLRNQLRAMSNGGTFVLTIPRTPFRAHAAAYERACVVADFFRRNKPASKVLILDANAGIAAMSRTFTAAFAAFNATHPGIVTYRPNVNVDSVGPGKLVISDIVLVNGIVTFVSPRDQGGDVFNVIPPQQAGKLAFASGLVPTGGKFAPVNPLNYESTLFPNKGVHVLGDAQATGQAKSGHMANSQAKICVDAILRNLDNFQAPDPAPKTTAVAFPFITRDTASWSSTTFAFQAPVLPSTVGTMLAVVTVPPGEAPRPTSDIREEGEGWLTNLLSDSFT